RIRKRLESNSLEIYVSSPASGLAFTCICQMALPRPRFIRVSSGLRHAHAPGNTRTANLALERGAIPGSTLGGRFVRRPQKRHQGAVWIFGRSHLLIGQQELSELRIVKRAGRLHAPALESCWHGVGVRIEHRILRTGTPGPEPGGRDLVAIRLP